MQIGRNKSIYLLAKHYIVDASGEKDGETLLYQII